MDTGCPEHVGSNEDVLRMPHMNNQTISSDKVLVDLLWYEFVDSGACSSSFSQEAWLRVWDSYQKITKEDTTLLQLKGRWKTLKKLYKLYLSLLGKSGWSWDSNTHRLTPVRLTMWDDIIKLNKEYMVCRDNPFPLYPKIHDIVASSLATGEYAIHTGGTVRRDDFVLNLDESFGLSDSHVFEVENDTNPPHSKKKSSDPTVEALNRLISLSDRRCRLMEQSKEEVDSFSFKTCMEKLSTMPGLSDMEVFVAAEALKSPENRVFFMTMRQSVIDYWLNQRVKEFRRQDPDQFDKRVKSGEKKFVGGKIAGGILFLLLLGMFLKLFLIFGAICL